jgi:hypothetical protein
MPKVLQILRSVLTVMGARLGLLPVPGREAERDHILLAVALRLAGLPNPLPERLEEFLFIYHASGCRIPRAETPRAD